MSVHPFSSLKMNFHANQKENRDFFRVGVFILFRFVHEFSRAIFDSNGKRDGAESSDSAAGHRLR